MNKTTHQVCKITLDSWLKPGGCQLLATAFPNQLRAQTRSRTLAPFVSGPRIYRVREVQESELGCCELDLLSDSQPSPVESTDGTNEN